MLAFRRFLAAAVLATSVSAHAQDPLGIAVAPFGEPYSSGAALSEEVELELELDAELLVTPSDDVKKALKAKSFPEADAQDLGRAMAAVGVQVLLRAETSSDGARALILIHRAPDGAVIAGKVVVINEFVGSAGPLAQELATIAKDVDALDPIPVEQLKAHRQELGGAPDEDEGRRIAGEPEPDPEPDGGEEAEPGRDRGTSRTDPPTGDPADQKTPVETPKRPDAALKKPAKEKRLDAIDDEKKKDDGEAGPKLFDRIFRATVRWSPPLLRYQSCQPKADGSDALPFLCAGEPDAPPQGTTVIPFFTPAAGGISVELYPWVPYAGFQLDAWVMRTVVPLTPLGTFDRDTLQILAGDVQAMGLVQGAFGFGPVGVAVGVRGGYLLEWALASEHRVQSASSDEEWHVTVFPGYMSHNLALGIHGGLSLHEYVRITLDVDVLPIGYQIEWPSQIGTDTLTLGGHGHFQVDVDPSFGFVLSAYVDATAISVRSSQTGLEPRYTRNLERMAGGQANLFVVKPGIGVGYRF